MIINSYNKNQPEEEEDKEEEKEEDKEENKEQHLSLQLEDAVHKSFVLFL